MLITLKSEHLLAVETRATVVMRRTFQFKHQRLKNQTQPVVNESFTSEKCVPVPERMKQGLFCCEIKDENFEVDKKPYLVHDIEFKMVNSTMYHAVGEYAGVYFLYLNQGRDLCYQL